VKPESVACVEGGEPEFLDSDDDREQESGDSDDDG
jgi:hypothetical protein